MCVERDQSPLPLELGSTNRRSTMAAYGPSGWSPCGATRVRTGRGAKGESITQYAARGPEIPGPRVLHLANDNESGDVGTIRAAARPWQGPRRDSKVLACEAAGRKRRSRRAPRTAGLPGGVPPPPRPEGSTGHWPALPAAVRRPSPPRGPLLSPQAGARAKRRGTPPTARRVPLRRVAPGAAAGAAFKPTTTLRRPGR